ncbi:unnamed protein product [Chilo suppressalis]|uniref:Carbonic anhydrase n=1 Tax=Chilo suppressalis TaxID=168631 RepID=A0ABN8L5U4_CHISP|nr:unnamed protein product [Chilo suppressalis]
MFTLVTVLLGLYGFTASDSSPNWSHRDESAWPGICGVGSQQSPINIKPHMTLSDPHKAHIRGPLVYRGYENVLVSARNTGYKVRWAVVPGTPPPVLSGGPLRGEYSFAEVHFHWLSEHAIDGTKYPLEIHLVHVKSGLTLAQALERPDGVAVIGVLAEVGPPNASPVLDELIPAVPYILKKSGEDSSQFTISISRLFSPKPQEYYTYHGSLTTPPCPEVVTWMVMAHPTVVSHENYKNLTKADLSGINNDRAVQPLRSRVVYRSMSLSSCSSALSPSSIGALATLLTCLTSKMASGVLDGMCRLANWKKKLFGQAPKQCS